MTAPAYLWVYMVFATVTISALILVGVTAALRQAGTAPSRRRRIVRSTALLLSAWIGLDMLLGWLGVFEAGGSRKVPWIAFGVAIPIIIGIRMIRDSEAAREVVRAVPQSWLVGLQSYRGLGSIFLVLFGMNLLPGAFALPAGFGDVLVGLAALPVAALYAGGSRNRDGWVLLWNMLGITDLVVALACGFLSAPGPLQLLSLNQPNYLVAAYPLVMVPLFAVPLSIVLHTASLSKVSRGHVPETTPALA